MPTSDPTKLRNPVEYGLWQAGSAGTYKKSLGGLCTIISWTPLVMDAFSNEASPYRGVLGLPTRSQRLLWTPQPCSANQKSFSKNARKRPPNLANSPGHPGTAFSRAWESALRRSSASLVKAWRPAEGFWGLQLGPFGLPRWALRSL